MDIKQVDDLEQLKQDLGGKVDRIRNVRILFLDVSSTCTGAVLAEVDFEGKKANFLESNAIWLPDVEQEHKCAYMYNTVCNYWNIVSKTDYVVLEKYLINKNRMMGTMVVPELHGSLKASFSEVGLKHAYILPQSWRKLLGIKKNEQKDFKEPTKQKILEYVSVPEKMVNNLTHNERNTPSDTYDSLAIAIAWLKKMGITRLDFSKIKYQTHVGYDVLN